MSVVVVGLSHRTAPLELLERMAMRDERLPKALHDLTARDFLSEAVVLSTCHRVEVYVVAERFHGAMATAAWDSDVMPLAMAVSVRARLPTSRA